MSASYMGPDRFSPPDPCRWHQMSRVPRSSAWWLRSALSLALAAALLAIALPVAFGGGAWGGGVDPAQFF